MNEKIKLGRTVRSRIDGFTGVAVFRCRFMTGWDRIGIRPKATDNKWPDDQWYDETELEIVGGEPTVDLGVDAEEPDIRFGSRVRDTVTGFTGTYTAVALYLTGCARMAVTPASGKSRVRESEWFDPERIEVIEEAGETVEKKRTGGPPQVGMPTRI